MTAALTGPRKSYGLQIATVVLNWNANWKCQERRLWKYSLQKSHQVFKKLNEAVSCPHCMGLLLAAQQPSDLPHSQGTPLVWSIGQNWCVPIKHFQWICSSPWKISLSANSPSCIPQSPSPVAGVSVHGGVNGRGKASVTLQHQRTNCQRSIF